MTDAAIKSAALADDALVVTLTDGRIISVPIAWYPRLMDAPEATRNNFRLIGRGSGIHWDDIDEDLSVAGILAGIPGRSPAIA